MSYQTLHDKNSDKGNVYLIRCFYQILHDKNSDKRDVNLIRCLIRSYTIKILVREMFIL